MSIRQRRQVFFGEDECDVEGHYRYPRECVWEVLMMVGVNCGGGGGGSDTNEEEDDKVVEEDEGGGESRSATSDKVGDDADGDDDDIMV